MAGEKNYEENQTINRHHPQVTSYIADHGVHRNIVTHNLPDIYFLRTLYCFYGSSTSRPQSGTGPHYSKLCTYNVIQLQ